MVVLKKKSFAFHMPKIRKKKQVSESKTSSTITNKTTSSKNISEIKKTDSKGNVIHNQADQVLVLKGHKAHAAILVIKIKNKLEDNEKKSLEHAMESVYNKKGAVYEQGDFIFAMFSPLMTNAKNNLPHLIYCTSVKETCKDVDAIIIATEWNEFRALDLKELKKQMKSKIIFDLRNIYNKNELINQEFEYYGIGK